MSRLGVVSSVCLAMLAMSAIASAADWPQFRGPNRDGVSTEKGLLQEWPEAGPPLAWKMTGLGRGYATVSIAGGKIFTMGDRGESQYVIAFDFNTHKELWATKVGGPWGDGGPRCTPTVDGDLCYALGTNGQLVCLQTATGKEVWRKDFGKDFGGKMMSGWTWSESPLVDGQKLICTPGGDKAALVALDKKTGAVIWKSAVPKLGPKGGDGAGYSSVVVSAAGDVRQYVQLMGRGLVSVAANDGKFLWANNNVANGTANITNPLVAGDYVFGTSSYGTGSALVKVTAAAGGVKAEQVYFLDTNTFQNHHGGVVLVDGYLYGGHGQNQGAITCVEMKTGKIVWQQKKTTGKRSAAIVYADGNLYCRYEDGTMVLVAATPKGYQEKGKFKLASVSGPSWPHPVILDGKLYIRANDDLLCYDVSKK
ncbi:MAG: PQQ-binding-like beta-propeller repeat protein [Pirellulales bacterium]